MQSMQIGDFEEHEMQNISGNVIVFIKLEIPAIYKTTDFRLHSFIRGNKIKEPLGLFEAFKVDKNGYFDTRKNARIVNDEETLIIKLSAQDIGLHGALVLYYELISVPKHKILKYSRPIGQ